MVTAAQHLGQPDALLEANRHLLWQGRRKPAAKMERPRLKPPTGSAIVGRRTIHERAKGGKRR